MPRITKLTAVILRDGKRYERDLEPSYYMDASIRRVLGDGGIFPMPEKGKTNDTIPEIIYHVWANRIVEATC